MKWLVRVVVYGTLFSLSGLWLGSEILYARRISPKGIHNVADHVRRFGEPRFVHIVERDGTPYYEFTGSTPEVPTWLALPSSLPTYVYDSHGKFTDWCKDPGDMPEYRKKWRKITNEPIDFASVEERLAQ